MCLTIDLSKHKLDKKGVPKPLKAKEDITVYKLFESDLISPHRGFRYEKGFIYYNTNKNPLGVGSYKRYWTKEEHWTVDRGFHAYTTAHTAKQNMFYNKMLKVIIPKGSLYYLGIDREIVSSQILIPH